MTFDPQQYTTMLLLIQHNNLLLLFCVHMPPWIEYILSLDASESYTSVGHQSGENIYLSNYREQRVQNTLWRDRQIIITLTDFCAGLYQSKYFCWRHEYKTSGSVWAVAELRARTRVCTLSLSMPP